ncbi:MAG: hypothetical protein H6713_28110 [Myxococcales bacterium]|nr:hypothetical protein [Myxococcales bacterium]
MTRGSRFSNHCRQTAAAAAKLGMGCVLVIRGEPPPRPAACCCSISCSAPSSCGPADAIRTRVPYRIADGGADALSTRCSSCARSWRKGRTGFDRFVVACSSGATQAGLPC